MMADIAASHYEPDSLGDGRKFLVNYYAESGTPDRQRPMRLMTTPGSIVLDDTDTLASGVRGLFQSDGHASGALIVPDGATVRLYNRSAGTWSSLTGTIAGTDRCQMAFGEAEAAILANGALYVSTGSAVAAVTDADWATLLSQHSKTVFTSVATIGQRLIATFGSRFGYSDTLDFNNTTTLSWYTAESSPDGLIGAYVLGDTLYLFGTQTIEPWVETGDTDNPFQVIEGSVVQRGCLARDTIHRLDNTLFFIGDDYNLHRLNGASTINLTAKDQWLVRKLQASTVSDIVCSTEEVDGHSFYIIRTSDFCYAYDVATGMIHKRQTLESDTWQWSFIKRVGAKTYGATTGTYLAELSREYPDDDMADADTLGTRIQRIFSGHLSVKSGKPAMGAIRLESTKGEGREVDTEQGYDPLATLYISNDKGITFGSGRQRSLGKRGKYATRTTWYRNGRAEPEQTVLKVIMSDPIKHSITGLAINESGR
jgi:hypothetical protein